MFLIPIHRLATTRGVLNRRRVLAFAGRRAGPVVSTLDEQPSSGLPAGTGRCCFRSSLQEGTATTVSATSYAFVWIFWDVRFDGCFGCPGPLVTRAIRASSHLF
jgi:hypothetical protein